MNRKNTIVILGAGFGGLRAAIVLAKKIRRSGMEHCELVLVDRNAYHTYTPTLYESATTSKETANYSDIKSLVTFPVETIVAPMGVEFIQSEVQSLDLQDGYVNLVNGRVLRPDHLILALGSETNYFDIPGLKEHSLTLKTFVDSLKIRDAVLEAVQQKKDVRIVVGGGGSTGVELAGEIQEWFAELADQFPGCRVRVTLVEAGPSLMLGFPGLIVEKIQGRLKGLGTEIITDQAIAKVAPEKILLAGGSELPYDLLIWTGGVKAASLMANLPLRLEKRGRVEVENQMRCLPQTPDLNLYGKVYGIGDAICFTDPTTGRPVPGVARAAISQADVAAHNVWCDITGDPRHREYRASEYPYVVPVGGKWAVAKLGPFIISGFAGWALKGLVELNYLLSIMPFWRAIRLWFKALLTFIQNDRLG